jgi:hypothetical protein
MALSIDEISRRAGIKGSSGSFDFAKEDARQDRLMEDTRHLTAGGKGAATPSTEGADRNRRRAVEAGLAPIIEDTGVPTSSFSLNDSIFESEASPSDRKNGTMTAYFNKSSNEYSIGPGLNINSSLVINALAKRGIDSKKLKEVYNFHRKQPIDQGLVPIMQEVFNEVVEGAKKDVRTFINDEATWKGLKQHEKDALSDMSYNLGLTKLGGFANMRKAIIHMVKNRSPEAITSVLAQMVDSKWYGQVGNRAVKIMQTFALGEDSDTKRWNELSG